MEMGMGCWCWPGDGRWMAALEYSSILTNETRLIIRKTRGGPGPLFGLQQPAGGISDINHYSTRDRWKPYPSSGRLTIMKVNVS
jgi:hypothetical protein